MKAACIDTHAITWYLAAPRRLGRAAVRWLRAADRGTTRVFVPAIVLVELSLLRERGRRVVGVADVEGLVAVQPAFSVVAMDLEQAREFALLSSIADPFDRMVVACARALDLPLISADAALHDAAWVETIWQ